MDHFSHKRNLDELLLCKDDDSGYIEGKVFMIWPPRNRIHRINLEVAQGSALRRFEVEVPHKDGITFRPHERVSLALKGMRIDQRKESSAPHYFPIILRFPDGVIFKYLSGANAGKVVDTWEGNMDEWYNSGVVHTVSDTVTVDASEIHGGPIPTRIVPAPPWTDLTSCHDQAIKPLPSSTTTSDGMAVVRSMQPAQQPSNKRSARSSKSKTRKRRRLQKEKESAFPGPPENDVDGPRPAVLAVSPHEQPQPSIRYSLPNIADSHQKLPQPSGHSNGEASTREDNGIDLSRENKDNDVTAISRTAGVPALLLKAGIRTQRGDEFTALNDLQAGHSMVNIIGVVIFVNQVKKTKTNEWSRSFTLVDPSTVDSSRQTITVNCFQKKNIQWLPQVQKDDIVILRKLKVVEFNGVATVTGYSDKLRWAVYDALEHSIRPPDKGSAPDKEVIDDGMGYEFSPYWDPEDSNELEYCQQIGEWWKARRELRGQDVSIVQCAGARKQHLLISEASPDLPPKGFFDCTVEVLQKFNNHGPATTVYVTDYTVNALVYPVQATWCPPELSGRVLQCAMWDNAKNLAQMMNPGEYWYFHNIRARWNPSHYMEGTMQLAEKVTQLDETNLEQQPHLRALLARKNELGLNKSCLVSGSASSHIFPEMLLQDVEGSTSFLTCIVELLHNDLNSRDGHFIYVTDYTYNPDLPTTVSTAEWAHNLQHRVLKIKLDDAQAKISSDFRPGSMFVIHNLRIKYSSASSGMHGCLGGESTLIHSLHDSSSHHAQTLQRHKEKWNRENMLDRLAPLQNGAHGELHEQPRRSSTPFDNTTIEEVRAKPSPGVFKVVARAMDFFPFSLEDASVLRCTKCELSPPPSFKQCPRCDDMLETHCKWFYRLFIQLRDEKDGELIVSLSGKECALLQDVAPTDFRCDEAVFRRFLTKLDPILGNLRDTHVAWSRNEPKVIESPLMIFTIESWDVGDERGYGLINCEGTMDQSMTMTSL